MGGDCGTPGAARTPGALGRALRSPPGALPLPHPPEAKGGVGSPPQPPAWSSRTGSGIVFLPIVPVPRPPPQVGGVLGRVQGARSELPEPCTAGVGAVPGMFTCEVFPPPARFILVPATGGRGQGGVIPPCFRILGGAELGREEKGPTGEGTPEILPGRAEAGRAVLQGDGKEERGRFGVSPSSTWFGS